MCFFHADHDPAKIKPLTSLLFDYGQHFQVFPKKNFSSWKLETHCTSVFFYADHDPAKIKPLTSLPFELLAKSTKVTNYYTQYNERAYCIPERHYKSGLRNTLLTATLLTPDSTQQDSDGSVTSTIPIEEVKYFPPPMRNIQ